ncbi:DUF192 domain-containing protein [Aurantimonas sp. Leaf443]|uniref:DUF192 domain-containing protein n=1 Tax=Aurantimonas sp. Leaf443 TaxID=1736378 RepID=UPI0006FA4B22|nr:DUF192 domain-containing protein [Aurantimonas sp. Leaf443]KQT86286.1 hypothetical protein ASG48_06920 [Aurantimonas sp. Leaf443]
MRKAAAFLALIACAGAGYLAFAADRLGTATLVTATGEHPIAVEIADTPKSREIGLMNRDAMPDGQGMLFDFEETRVVTMWMKNTLIPLDMLFIDETGTVTRVAANAKPLSLELIPSGPPVRYVLELNGGAAARYGAKAGDRLRHEIISAP